MVLSVVGKMLLEQALEIGVNYAVPKATAYMEKNIPKAIDYVSENLPKAFNYAKENIPKVISRSGKNSDEEYIQEEEVTHDIIFDIIQLLNKDTKILNNHDDKQNAKFIEKKLEKNNDFYKFIDINVDFVEEIIKSIRYDAKIKYNLMNEFKERPQIIKQKNSAISKTVCANCGIEINDEIKKELSLQIDVVKKILELHKSGANTKEIFEQVYYANDEGFCFAFDFEINQFIKIFANV